VALGLGLANINLTHCRFAGAHNVDKLRLEANVAFGLSPARAGWERRQVIAEESAWRNKIAEKTINDSRWSRRIESVWLHKIAEDPSGSWTNPDWPSYLDDIPNPDALEPAAIASLYRALRKGREDVKDEPGAADFYYGEMEMRRHSRGRDDTRNKSRGLVSYIVLTAYWLLSGYGLRAWRSFAALVIVIAGIAAAFCLWGFTRSTSYWKSLLFSFRSTISLTDTQVNLTAWGGLFQALLRLTGPVLLALTLLALRGRVKR